MMYNENVYKSVIAHFYSQWGVTVYEEEINDTPALPSMFFPIPEAYDMPHSKDQFRNIYTMNIKVFHLTTNKAMDKANELSDTVRVNKFTISINNKDGSPTEEVIVVDSITTSPIDDGVAQITLVWQQDKDYI